jgi:hypothetical protein
MFYRVTANRRGHLACQCPGDLYYCRCRHVERAAAVLEDYPPKTPSQAAFEAETRGDPVRAAYRRGEALDALPRPLRAAAGVES